MTQTAYEKFLQANIPPKDQPIYTGPLADTPMAFEHPFSIGINMLTTRDAKLRQLTGMRT